MKPNLKKILAKEFLIVLFLTFFLAVSFASIEGYKSYWKNKLDTYDYKESRLSKLERKQINLEIESAKESLEKKILDYENEWIKKEKILINLNEQFVQNVVELISKKKYGFNGSYEDTKYLLVNNSEFLKTIHKTLDEISDEERFTLTGQTKKYSFPEFKKLLGLQYKDEQKYIEGLKKIESESYFAKLKSEEMEIEKREQEDRDKANLYRKKTDWLSFEHWMLFILALAYPLRILYYVTIWSVKTLKT
jgi:hypothetical protein